MAGTSQESYYKRRQVCQTVCSRAYGDHRQTCTKEQLATDSNLHNQAYVSVTWQPDGNRKWPAVKCGSADLQMLTRVKCGLIMRIFRCGFTGKMRTRLRIFTCCFFSAEAGLLLKTKDCTPTLGHTNYTQVLGERFLTCKLRNFFNEVLKQYPK